MERIYSILIVNSSKQLGELLPPFVPEGRFYPIKYCDSVCEARRAMMIRPFDIVFVNSPLHDENGVQFAMDISKKGKTVCLLSAPAILYPEYEARLRGRGVFLLKKPFPVSTLALSLDWLRVASDRIETMEGEKLSIEEKMEEIRIVNRAKWVLIEDLKMTEEEAHRYISKEAMDRCISKKEMATTILSTYRN